MEVKKIQINHSHESEIEDRSKNELKKDSEHIIVDACNQFTWFELYKKRNIEEIKQVILEANLKTLEGYLTEKFGDIHQTIIEKVKQDNPGVFHKYNSLIERLKSPNLNYEEYLKILEESREIYKDFKYQN